MIFIKLFYCANYKYDIAVVIMEGHCSVYSMKCKCRCSVRIYIHMSSNKTTVDPITLLIGIEFPGDIILVAEKMLH